MEEQKEDKEYEQSKVTNQKRIDKSSEWAYRVIHDDGDNVEETLNMLRDMVLSTVANVRNDEKVYRSKHYISRDSVKEIVVDWFSKAPKYRTKENLLQTLDKTTTN